ncbi:hypothetical protein DY000_02029814 [Brassica cretica]|uniref:Uncharacterized protein n=1 Tax=Brassica cretica TaxID=69181 RepID=A0ABQ7DJE7_BRACR|nr:hypothetical protein DY000_02029814 [Brassica cretica]
MVKKTTHDGSQVLNRSWSKGSSTVVADVVAEADVVVLVKTMWSQGVELESCRLGEQGSILEIWKDE